ncbi:MAG TPA: hypothetical protein PKE57_02970 [Cellvibrionaceae bacterium]|nr:hypothetical protein [Cellvibrionaceae bacterium]
MPALGFAIRRYLAAIGNRPAYNYGLTGAGVFAINIYLPCINNIRTSAKRKTAIGIYYS